MALLWPYEWWRDGMPQQTIHDAKGRRLRHVVACDPVTGEVIDLLPAETWIGPLLIALERPMEAIWRFLWRRGVDPSPGEVEPSPGLLAQRHYFAPAPLTITRAEP